MYARWASWAYFLELVSSMNVKVSSSVCLGGGTVFFLFQPLNTPNYLELWNTFNKQQKHLYFTVLGEKKKGKISET